MRTLLRVLTAALTTTLIVASLGTPAIAAPDYRDPVDITFPAISTARYSDDFHNPRSGGRVHRATDLFSAAGTKIFAARGGTVIWLPPKESGNAGFAIQIRGDDGRVYAYYHLGPAGGTLRQAVAKKVRLGAQVARGQYIGRLGDSGNAAGGAPHLHFEIHDSSVVDPYGSNRRNPYASLRRAQGLPVHNASPSASTNAKPTLRRGDRGEAVAKWQKRLNRVHRPKMVVDGIFGPGTESATVAFQQSAGLGPDGLGIVGPKTRKALTRAIKAKKAAKDPPPPTTKATTKTKPPILSLGDRGTAVTKWQRRLNRTRDAKITVDGHFGPQTRKATMQFQTAVGLGPAGLGIVGPKTRKALKRVLQAR